MYDYNDKPRAIYEIQRLLKSVSREMEVPSIAIDGIYSEETRAAVLAFQKIEGLAELGEVDLITFTRLYQRAEEIEKALSDKNGTPNAGTFPLRLGEASENITKLNSNLRALKEFYRDLPEIRGGSFFSRETDAAVKDMQRVFLETPTGLVSHSLYQRLFDELLEREKFRN